MVEPSEGGGMKECVVYVCVCEGWRVWERKLIQISVFNKEVTAN